MTLRIYQDMNGYQINAICGQYRTGDPSGAVIMGIRVDDESPPSDNSLLNFVVATVPQSEIDSPDPARFWDMGIYTSGDAAKATAEFAEKSGIQAVAGYEARPRS